MMSPIRVTTTYQPTPEDIAGMIWDMDSEEQVRMLTHLVLISGTLLEAQASWVSLEPNINQDVKKAIQLFAEMMGVK